ncbi:hypothetical protein A2Z33_04930 [Candidatus Gottesmanbacteria bacterium RBG_16_52_11]|uniref:Glycosyl transferase family 1 domain-containing protein n=1 Tax=Candidatus Gottesmanbacteria bacterium RBG_16_52_11 TaxID=1798374 RepID=A0A1F5YUE5_9BACT|nr:MAG: hypothetical protein A2Z33_04930 [Candidatus Gottesmanbacteria bacterium RBG_16_52_11]
MTARAPKVALVYDRVTKFGGAERVLLAISRIWPDAPLYTSVYNPRKAGWAAGLRVVPSALDRLPFVNSSHELFAWAMPLAFESFDLSSYDIVLSVTSAEAKHVITRPETLHICYCLTPTRYLWSGFGDYMRVPGLGPLGPLAAAGLRYLAPALRRWDLRGAAKPDRMVAISDHVGARILRYYRRRPDAVIYPPVDLEIFRPGPRSVRKRSFYLTVGRFVGYKRLDIVVEAFNRTGLPLVVIGSGRDGGRLMKMAKKNVRFVTNDLTDKEMVHYYNQCIALCFAGSEDFGLISVEAQACGAPVITYSRSGMAETVIHGKTGYLFDSQSSSALVDAVRQAGNIKFSDPMMRSNAEKFSTGRFMKEISEFTIKSFRSHRNRFGAI